MSLVAVSCPQAEGWSAHGSSLEKSQKLIQAPGDQGGNKFTPTLEEFEGKPPQQNL